MELLSFVPGAVVAGNPITLPAGTPDIEAVVASEIQRLAASFADHPAADITAALADHAAAAVVAAIADHPAADIVGALADHTAAVVVAAFANHTQANIVAAIADHAVHAHTIIISAGGGGAPVEAFGASGAGVANIISASGQTIPGGGGMGVQNNAAVQAHAAGGAPVAHAVGVAVAHAVGAAAVTHTAGGAPVAHAAGVAVTHAAATPVVASVPTRSTTRIITLDVNTLVGDVLTLSYREVGESVLTS